MTMNELKPCPFCGRIDKLIINEVHHSLDDMVIKQYRVCCSAEGDNTGCGASCGYQPTEEEAVKAWNMRNAQDKISNKEQNAINCGINSGIMYDMEPRQKFCD